MTTTTTRKNEKIGSLPQFLFRELRQGFRAALEAADAELCQNPDNGVWLIYPGDCRPEGLIASLKNDAAIMLEWHKEQERKQRERLAGQPVWQ